MAGGERGESMRGRVHMQPYNDMPPATCPQSRFVAAITSYTSTGVHLAERFGQKELPFALYRSG